MTKKTNLYRGEVALTLKAKSYRLVPSYENLAALEENAETSILDLATRLHKRTITIDDLSKIIACTSMPEISVEKAGQDVVDEGLVKVIEPISKFLSNALLGGSKGNAIAAEET